MMYIAKLDEELGQRTPPWTRQIITRTSLEINQVCSGLTICNNECRAGLLNYYAVPITITITSYI